jgi:hypothetical protein
LRSDSGLRWKLSTFATGSLKHSSLSNLALAAFISGLVKEEGRITDGQEETGKSKMECLMIEKVPHL